MSGQLTDVYHSILTDIAKGLLTVQYSTYVVASNPFAWEDEEAPPAFTGTQADINELRQNMVVGVKIGTDDIVNVVRRVTWASNTVYDQWDQTLDMKDLDYYVINSSSDVFICLSNNAGIPSTTEPTSKTTVPFTLADGYIWKYLYTVSEANQTKFGTSDYIPLTANTTVTAAAVRGTIYAYKVANTNVNFFDQEEGLIAGVITSNTFQIQNTANAASNTFGGSALYISDGTGVGSLVGVTTSFANASGRYITTDTALSLDLTSEYMISPRVTVTGDGVGAKAIAVVQNKSLKSVLSINPGNNYTYADVTVAINPSFSANATVQALVSPITGHGANTNIELISKKLAISTRIEPDVSADLPPGIKYRQVGVIIAPWSPSFVLSNTEVITFATKMGIASGTFSNGDVVIGGTSAATGTVYKANSSQVSVVNVLGSFANSETITCSSTGQSGVVNSLNARDADKNSGQVLYYTNVLPINKSNTSAEQVHIIINFEG